MNNALACADDFSGFEDATFNRVPYYKHHGYWVEHGLLDPGLCDHIVSVARAHSDKEFSPLYMPHRLSSFFMDMLRFKPIVDVAEDLLGGFASGLGSEYFFCKPGVRGFTPHQDNTWVQAPIGCFLHAWVALCDVGVENGCMQFWPSSHLNGELPIVRLDEEAGPGQNPGARAFTCGEPVGGRSMDVCLRKGDVVFWDSLLVHSSLDNNSDRFRDSLLLTYLLRGSSFNPGVRQKREEIKLR